MLNSNTILVLLFTAIPQLVIADDAADLASLLANYETLSGNFEQSLVDSQQAPIQTSTGTFILKKPGYFRWDTQQPFPQLLVSNLQRIWLYDPDLEQVTIRPYQNHLDQGPSLLLSGDVDKITANYDVTKEQGKEKISTDTFVLKPMETQSSFTELRLVFREETLTSMVLKDTLEQTTTFAFTNLTLNPPLDASRFEFTPPDGVDVLIDD